MKVGMWAGAAIVAAGWAQGQAAIAANPEQVQMLTKTNQCLGCDLSNADLKNLNLFGANLVGADLTGADLSGANLGSANLTDANLSGATLNRTYFYLATLENANLSRADLTNAYLRDALLLGTNMSGATLKGVNLSRTNLAGINLRGADLSGANLSETVMTRTTFPGLNPKSELQQLSFFFLTGFSSSNGGCRDLVPDDAKRQGFNILFTDLREAKLRDANLSNALLAYNDLSGADLTNANLTSALMVCTKLNNATLDGATLTDARLDGAILKDASLKDVKNANLDRAFPSEDARQAAPSQSAARSITGSMNRGQQAYYLENSRFARRINDLGMGITPDTDRYLYRTFAQGSGTKARAINAAIARSEGLKSYIGFVRLSTQSRETFTLATLCESEKPTRSLPSAQELAQLSEKTPCPSGYKPLN